MERETAMKILKELHNKSLFAERTALETIIPELKESEDEKIRKALVRFHKSTIDIDGIKGADILAWLEKQGESYTKKDVDDAYLKGIIDAKNELEKQGESSDQIHYWTEEEIEPIISDYLRGVEHYGGMIGRLRCLKPKSLEKQGKVPVTINIDKMVRNYANNKECGNEGFGKPINCMIRAYRQGIMDTLEKQVNCSAKWQKNTPENKPTIRHSVLMKTIQGIAEGEWQGEHWFQYRWSWTFKDSEVLAWMELSDLNEQGEQKTAVTDFNAKDWYVSKVDGKIHDMTYNPADKVEPKFHKGEWIVWKNKCYKVNYNGCGYELIDQNGLSTSLEYGTVDENAHLWDITKDAKDGDVVVDKSDGTIGIFESIGHHPDGGSFNDPSYCFLHCRYDDGYFFADFEDGNMMTSDDVIPAIKEQSDILFTEMKEAGYEWDAEKKELKKIEQRISDNIPQAFEKYVENLLSRSDGEGHGSPAKVKEVSAELFKLAKLKQKPAWSEEDENYLQSAENACEYQYGKNTSTILWLKSLKDRVQPQPKQEWSEEDEKIALSIEQVMNCASLLNLVPEKIEKVRAWLKSLKDRIGG